MHKFLSLEDVVKRRTMVSNAVCEYTGLDRGGLLIPE